MTYIDLINSFWRRVASEDFSAGEIALYLFLVQQCNIRRWQNPFALRSKSIEGAIGMSRNGIAKARRRLEEKGLVRVVKGEGSTAPVFTICAVDLHHEPVPGNRPYTTRVMNTPANAVTKVMNMSASPVDTKVGTNAENGGLMNMSAPSVASLGSPSVTRCVPRCVTCDGDKGDTNRPDTSIYKKDKDIKTKTNTTEGDNARVSQGSPSPLDIDVAVEFFIRDNGDLLPQFLKTHGIGEEEFRARGAEVASMWVARGWRPCRIRRGRGEYDAMRFLTWVAKQCQIARERAAMTPPAVAGQSPRKTFGNVRGAGAGEQLRREAEARERAYQERQREQEERRRNKCRWEDLRAKLGLPEDLAWIDWITGNYTKPEAA